MLATNSLPNPGSQPNPAHVTAFLRRRWAEWVWDVRHSTSTWRHRPSKFAERVFWVIHFQEIRTPSSDEHHHLLKWAPSFLSLNHTLLRKKSLLRKKYARIYQLQSKGHVVFSGKNRNKWSWRSNQYWTKLSYQTSQLVSCWEPGEATYANFVALSPECDWTLIINDPILYPGTL